jgi:hypothetical protein
MPTARRAQERVGMVRQECTSPFDPPEALDDDLAGIDAEARRRNKRATVQ